jgi:C_GCAxxG_C_C family probable redox protein
MKKQDFNRRDFFKKSLACSACLASTSFISEVLASAGDKTKEEILQELDQKVDDLMPEYGNCAQTSFGVLNKQFKLKAKKMIPALKPFPGIALRGETCGAVSGSMLAIGLYFESAKRKDSRQTTNTTQYASEFTTAFENEFGSTMCKGVQQHQYDRSYDLRDEKEKIEFMQAAASGKCKEVVKRAVRFAGEIMIDNT